MDTEKQRQHRCNDMRLTKCQKWAALMMPTESLTNREWLPGEFLSGSERQRSSWTLDMKYQTSLPCILADPSHPAVWLLHMLLSMQTSLAIPLVLPSPLHLHTTHSHFIISVSKEAISTVLSNIFIISTAFLTSHTSPVNPQKHWTLHLYIFFGH